MQILAEHIRTELRTRGICAVYKNDLNRVWPENGKKRAGVIDQFAKENGWQLSHYKDGFVAIFTKAPEPPPSDSN
jgi:hypothetical protein